MDCRDEVEVEVRSRLALINLAEQLLWDAVAESAAIQPVVVGKLFVLMIVYLFNDSSTITSCAIEAWLDMSLMVDIDGCNNEAVHQGRSCSHFLVVCGCLRCIPPYSYDLCYTAFV